MVILVVFNSFNVVKNLKKPNLVARQKPPFYTTHLDYLRCADLVLNKRPNVDEKFLFITYDARTYYKKLSS